MKYSEYNFSGSSVVFTNHPSIQKPLTYIPLTMIKIHPLTTSHGKIFYPEAFGIDVTSLCELLQITQNSLHLPCILPLIIFSLYRHIALMDPHIPHQFINPHSNHSLGFCLINPPDSFKFHYSVYMISGNNSFWKNGSDCPTFFL